MPDFAIALGFTAKDGVSSKFGLMTKGVNKFGESSRSSFSKASRGAAGFGNIVKGILSANIIQKGISLLISGIRAVGQEFVDLDQSITSASSKFKGLNLNTKEGQDTLLALEKTARDVGAAVEFTAAEAGAGLEFLAMAGFNADQAMTSLRPTADLATLANSDLATATDIASDSLGAFGLMTNDTGKLLNNYNRLNDVMAKTMNSSNTDLITLFESVKKGASAFTAAGQSLESFNALAGVMANSGVKGAESGTMLRNIMLRLASPTAEAGDVLNKMNIRTQDAQGNFRDVVDILSDFEKGLIGMGTAQKTAALATVFGARSVTGINVLLDSGTKSIRNFRDELLNAGGTAQKTAERMRTSIQNRLASLKSASIELGFKFMDVFKNDISNAISFVTDIVRKINFEPIRKFLSFIVTAVKKINFDPLKKGFFGFIKIIKGTIPIVKKIFKSIIDLGKAVLNLAKVIFSGFIPSGKKAGGMLNGLLKGFNLIIKVATVFIRAITPIVKFLKPLAIAIGAIILATKIWAAIQIVLNVILTANPIGLIIAAVGILVVAIVALVQNWHKVVGALKLAWDWFSKLLDNPFIATAGVMFAPMIAIPALIIKHWKPLSEFFVKLWGGITTAANITWEALKTGFFASIGFIKKVFFGFADIILNIFGRMAAGIIGFVAKVGKFLKIDVAGLESAVQGINAVREFVSAEAAKPILPESPAGENGGKNINESRVTLDINGAPVGSKLSNDNPAPGINLKLQGVNP